MIFTTTNKRIDPKPQIEWRKEKDRFDSLRICMQQTIMKDEIMGFACILNTMGSDPLRSCLHASFMRCYIILHDSWFFCTFEVFGFKARASIPTVKKGAHESIPIN